MTDLVIATAPGSLADYADPAAFVELALTHAKEWLVQCVEQGDIESIVELKSQAEAIRVYTAQKQLGKDAELTAAEIVRRAERGLGLAIRKGQAEGTIRTQGVTNYRPGQHIGVANVLSPVDVAPNTNERSDVYAVTDNVSDEQFEDAITAAREEKNMSRANVVRKVKGEEKPKPADRSEWHYGTQHIKAERVVEESITLLEGVASALALVHEDIPSLELQKRLAWSEALREPLAVINRFKKELKL